MPKFQTTNSKNAVTETSQPDPTNETAASTPKTLYDVMRDISEIIAQVSVASVSLQHLINEAELGGNDNPYRHGVLKRLQAHLGEFVHATSGVASIIRMDKIA